MKPLRRLGIGYIATISGIEFTNIALYFVIGSYYGLFGIILIAILMLPIIYLQEFITYLSVKKKSDMYSLMRNYVRRVAPIYYVSIYVSSSLIAFINLYVLSTIYSNIFGGSWLGYMLLLIISLHLIGTRNSHIPRFEKILVYLSVFLTLYLVSAVRLMVMNGFSISFTRSHELTPYVLIALFGALASPYSLVLQEDSRNSDDLLLGYFYGVLIGSSIAITGYFIYSSGGFSILSLLQAMNNDMLTIYLIMAGLSATVFLATLSVIRVNQIIFRRLSPSSSHGVHGYMDLFTLILFSIILSLYSRFSSYTVINAVVDMSFIVGVFTGLDIVLLLILYVRCEKEKNLDWFLNFAGLSSVTAVFILALFF